jgi:hypothetical protein
MRRIFIHKLAILGTVYGTRTRYVTVLDEIEFGKYYVEALQELFTVHQLLNKIVMSP